MKSKPPAIANCHKATVFKASFNVQLTSSFAAAGLIVSFSRRDSSSPSGNNPTDSGVSAKNRNTGSKAITHTPTPKRCQATCQPYIPIKMEAIKGKPVIPIEWQNVSMPFARPRFFMNHLETTTDEPICTGLLKMILPIP